MEWYALEARETWKEEATEYLQQIDEYKVAQAAAEAEEEAYKAALLKKEKDAAAEALVAKYTTAKVSELHTTWKSLESQA